MKHSLFLFALALFSITIPVTIPIHAQSDTRSLYWDRFDVTIQVIDTTTNHITVTEDYAITIEEGPFSFGYREIPLGRIEEITDVEIYVNGSPLTPGCDDTPGTFCADENEEIFSIQYYSFSPMETGQSREIQLQYDVYGALRYYEDGDELAWIALTGDMAFPIKSSTVSVIMPEEIRLQAVTSTPETWFFSASQNIFQWNSTSKQNEIGKFEVRVKYEHNPSMSPPAWQLR